MFALGDAELGLKILGCGDGPSSFNKEMTALNGSVVSIDPLYRFRKAEIAERISETARTVLKQVEQNKAQFVWESIRSVAELESIRMSAMHEFLEDYERGIEEKRYIQASLPVLPFADKHFDLAVCSHFLFLYSEQLDLEFHIASFFEMCRVADEVRVFPLLDLKGGRSVYLEPLINVLQENGYHCRIETVGYAFQKGGNEMLKVQRVSKVSGGGMRCECI